MVDITHKRHSLRQAIALAVVSASDPETIEAIRGNRVPKGDVFAFSRAAGLLAIKKTSDVIPDCHPLPVEYAAITHELVGLDIRIRVEVHAIYRTGVEVEAMHGAMITALTLYDMLKPLDKALEIKTVKLESKQGGKAAVKPAVKPGFRCAVIVCSDRVSAGHQQDVSGKLLLRLLEEHGIPTPGYGLLPDDVDTIRQKASDLHGLGFDLVVFTGGTGSSARDVTPEAIKPLLDQEIPGIMETARQFGQQRTPLAMLSRGVAGFMGDTLLVTLPGSPKAVKDAVDALFPAILHAFAMRRGEGH